MAKKHKKKIYNTPKKIKHTHKNITITNFLQSLNNLKCEICNSSLATHCDRYYCGKCNNSINL